MYKVHILGIGGTFMAGVAVIAKQMGYEVSGSDQALYPPMSDVLATHKIPVIENYKPHACIEAADIIVVGNAISRGNEALEFILDHDLTYISGPQWLAEQVLSKRWVLAVSGTHGKTTTSSLLVAILAAAGLQPGYLIGGVPQGLTCGANLGEGKYFVIEADEYDCVFYDKRPKFMHYHPRTLIINNLEFDHADIYAHLDAIKLQFGYLLRTVPSNGLVIANQDDSSVMEVLQQGQYIQSETFSIKQGDWQAKSIEGDGGSFAVYYKDELLGELKWQLIGQHNVYNALAAIAAAHTVGVEVSVALQALAEFKGVHRRLQKKAQVNDITIYDDFAHHPTAIASTLAGLRAKVKDQRIIAVLHFASYTMRAGFHKERMAESLKQADGVFIRQPEFSTDQMMQSLAQPAFIIKEDQAAMEKLAAYLRPGDHVLCMSNKDNSAFIDALAKRCDDLT